MLTSKQSQGQETNMIQLTRLNNHPLVVNSDLIKFVEQAPDTVITLVNGDKIVVRERAQDVLERVVQFRRSVLQGITPWSDTGSALPPVIRCNAGRNANGNAEGNGKDQDQPTGAE
jgi:flagellar protein FlbD